MLVKNVNLFQSGENEWAINVFTDNFDGCLEIINPIVFGKTTSPVQEYDVIRVCLNLKKIYCGRINTITKEGSIICDDVFLVVERP